MLKSYSHFSVDEFRHVFEKLIKLIEFNYGIDSSIFISVYCISSFYFAELSQSNNGDNSPKASQLYVLGCKLLHEAEKLCLKHFG